VGEALVDAEVQGLGDAVGDPLMEGVGQPLAVGDALADGQREANGDALADALSAADAELEGELLGKLLLLLLGDGPPEPLWLWEPLPLPEGDALEDALRDCPAERDGWALSEADGEEVQEAPAEPLKLGLGDALREKDGDGEPLLLGSALSEPLEEPLGAALRDPLRVAKEALGQGLADALCEATDPLARALAETQVEALWELEALRVAWDALADAVGEPAAEALVLPEVEGDFVEELLRDADALMVRVVVGTLLSVDVVVLLGDGCAEVDAPLDLVKGDVEAEALEAPLTEGKPDEKPDSVADAEFDDVGDCDVVLLLVALLECGGVRERSGVALPATLSEELAWAVAEGENVPPHPR
jgi:hypothetical protein